MQQRTSPWRDRCARTFCFAAWLGAGAGAQAQEPPPPAEDPARLLSRAAEVQGAPRGEEGRTALELEALLQHRTDDGTDVTNEVRRRFLSVPAGEGRREEYVWTELFDEISATRSARAWDGRRAWQVDRAGNGPPQLFYYEGPEHQEDRKALERDLEETRLVADVFFLAHLSRRLENLRRLPDSRGYGKEAFVLEGKSHRTVEGRREPVTLRLWLEKESLHLYGAQVEPASGEERLTLCFWGHARNEDGIVVPRLIKVFHGDEKEPREVLSGLRVDFDAALEPEDFQPPRR